MTRKAEIMGFCVPRSGTVACVGAGLLLYGLSRRSIPGAMLAGIGLCALATQIWPEQQIDFHGLPVSRPPVEHRPQEADIVDESSFDSFPASDPPAWTVSRA